MNILNAIGSGLRNVGQGIGTGALAAGKGLADYLNAQAMRQSGLTPEQLQQNPQLARSAMGNWLGSIGQGMQTGDYTGSRLGYQQEMLTKLQNLQAMKQQEAAKQRQAAFQQAMAQADTPDKVAAVGRMFPEYGEQVAKSMDQFKAISGMNRDFAAASYDDTQAAHLKWQEANPKKSLVKGVGKDGLPKMLAVDEYGNVTETDQPVGDEHQVFGDRMFQWSGKTGEWTEIGAKDKPDKETNDILNARFFADPKNRVYLQTWLKMKEAGSSGSGQSGSGSTRPMPQTQFGNFKKAFDQLDQMANLAETFNDGYFGHIYAGDKTTRLQKLGLPDSISGAVPGQAEWWAQYSSFRNDVRNKRFGATLMPAEVKEFEKESIDETTSPNEARRIFNNQMRIVSRALEREYKSSSATYNRDQIEPYNPAQITDRLKGLGAGWLDSPKATPPQAPSTQGASSVPTVSNAQEFNSLPAGSLYIDKRDGKQKRKKP